MQPGKFILPIAILLFFGGIAIGYFSHSLDTFRHGESRRLVAIPSPVVASPHYPPGAPLPSFENLVIRSEFTSSISYRFKQPNWVAEKLTIANRLDRTADRKDSNFQVDMDVPPIFRATLEDYAYSGYCRGHMARSGFHLSSQSAQNETFLLSSNIVPQDLSNNGDAWLRVENFAGLLADVPDRDVYILSGPAWMVTSTERHMSSFSSLPKRVVSYEVIGENEVAVPTHLFKVIKVVNRGSTAVTEGEASPPFVSATAAFLVPNRPEAVERPLTEYQIPLSSLAKSTGLDLSGMDSGTDLCAVLSCDPGPSNDMILGWRAHGLIQQTRDHREFLDLVAQAVAAGHLNENILLRRIIHRKSWELRRRDSSDIVPPELTWVTGKGPQHPVTAPVEETVPVVLMDEEPQRKYPRRQSRDAKASGEESSRNKRKA